MIRKYGTTRNISNEHGVIDLASIMVGIIVIGMIGGVVATTVFAVIPWAQDNAAKHQLDSINVAQVAYKAKASDPSTAGEGFVANSYADSTGLGQTRLLTPGSNYCTAPTSDGGYTAFSRSASGKIFTITDKNTSPRKYTVTLQDASLPGCEFLKESLPEGTTPVPPAPVVPTPVPDVLPESQSPNKTIITYKCSTQSVGFIPMQDIDNGKLTVEGSDGTKTENDYSGVIATDEMLFKAGIEYKVTFEGVYYTFRQSYGVIPSNCIRSLDHWGNETGVTNAASGMLNATNLTSVPNNIPSTVVNMQDFFKGAKTINDGNISNWNMANVTNVSNMFNGATAFNKDLTAWKFNTIPTRTNFQNAGFPSNYLPQQFR